MEFVLGRQDRDEAFCDIAHQVDADEVVKSKHARLRDTERPAENGIRFLDAQAQAKCLVQRRLDGEDANPVTEEPGRVVAHDDSLAHARVVEPLETVHDICPGVRTAHEFEQAHVAHRVEKMRDCKLGTERRRHLLDQQGYRDRRGV